MRSAMSKLLPGVLAILAAVAFSAWAYPQLPEQVATHFDLHGNANGWSSRLFAIALLPMIGTFMALLFSVLPNIDPRRANYAQFGSTYWIIVNAVMVLLAGIHVLSLGKSIGWPVNMSRIVSVGVGCLFVLLGNLMTRIRPNWFMGIRTPWTLSSDTVWRKTHRFGGVAFVIAGLCIAVTSFFTAPWAMFGAFGVAAAASLSSVIYSYVVWRQEQQLTGAEGPSTR